MEIMSFNKFCEVVQEKLITFGNKAYPKFGNVVILAGGAGSGKGFQLGGLIGIDGKVFDVDELKKLALKIDWITKILKDQYNIDPDQKDIMRNPDVVSKLHEVIADELKLPDKRQAAFFASVITADPERKPNIIFDVTLKNMKKLDSLTRHVSALGYKKENIHIVWIMNHIDVALKQNAERERVVHKEILLNTHQGASLTMKSILDMGDSLKKWMDGDIWFSFNQINVDTEIVGSGKDEKGRKRFSTDKFEKDDAEDKFIDFKGEKYKAIGRGGSFWVDATYLKVKSKGKPQSSSSEIDKDLYRKIKEYVPIDNW